MQHDSPPVPQVSEPSFPTDPTGLSRATKPEALDLADGGTLNLRVTAVAKQQVRRRPARRAPACGSGRGGHSAVYAS
jgi:hypothetical protein